MPLDVSALQPLSHLTQLRSLVLGLPYFHRYHKNGYPYSSYDAVLPYTYTMQRLEGLDLGHAELSRGALAALAARLPQLRGLSFAWVLGDNGCPWHELNYSTAAPTPPLQLPPALRLLRLTDDYTTSSAALVAELLLGAAADGPGSRRRLLHQKPYFRLDMPNAGTGDAEGDCSVWSFTLLPTRSNEAPWVSGVAVPQTGALAPDLVATHVRGLVSLILGPRGGLRSHAGGGAEGGSGDGANDHDGSGGGDGGRYVAGGGRDEELEELIGWDATAEYFGHEHGLPAYVPRGGFEGLWLVGDGSRWCDPMPGPHHAWLRELVPLDPLRLLGNPCRGR